MHFLSISAGVFSFSIFFFKIKEDKKNAALFKINCADKKGSSDVIEQTIKINGKFFIDLGFLYTNDSMFKKNSAKSKP